MKKKLNIKLFQTLMLLVGFIFPHLPTIAQTSIQASSKESFTAADIINYSLLLVAFVLGVGIIILSNALSSLSREKFKKAKSVAQRILPLFVVLILLSSQTIFAQNNQALSTDKNTLSWTNEYTTYTLIMVILFEGIAYVFLAAGINRLSKPIKEKSIEESPVESAKTEKSFWDQFNDSVELEKEQDILLDHNYDGIKELDNDLPPWWKYGFYFSLAIGAIYLMHFHVFGTGQLQYQEYESEMAEAKMKVDEYRRLSANNVDESSVTMAEASGINDGKTVFAENCVACHGTVGEGASVGPNLTDAYWIHGGDIKDVFKTIKYGFPEKGMRSWQSELSPVQIKNVSSYILSLQGSNPPNAKAPQGVLYMAGAPDSTSVKGDSSSVSKMTIDSTKL